MERRHPAGIASPRWQLLIRLLALRAERGVPAEPAEANLVNLVNYSPTAGLKWSAGILPAIVSPARLCLTW